MFCNYNIFTNQKTTANSLQIELSQSFQTYFTKLTLIFFILKISQTRFKDLRKTISVPNFKTISFTPVIV